MLARQAASFSRNQHLRAKLLRLGVSVAGELVPGNAGGKTEIVFDLRTRSGLPAGRTRFDYQDVETFRRTVDRRRQTGWASADDDQVSHVCSINSFIQTETR